MRLLAARAGYQTPWKLKLEGQQAPEDAGGAGGSGLGGNREGGLEGRVLAAAEGLPGAFQAR